MISGQIKRHHLFSRLTESPHPVALLLFFTLACYGVHIFLNPFPKPDALTYLHILQYWNHTGSSAAVWEKFPKFGLLLFSFLPLKWAAQIGIPLYPASIVWMMMMSMVSVCSFYKIVLLLTGSREQAMWCGLLLSVHPHLLLYAGNLLRDTPYLMFCLLHILFFIDAIRCRKRRFFLLTGVTLAMSVLSRYESWELLVLFPLYSVFYLVKAKFTRREILQFVLLAAAGFAAAILLMFSAIDDLPGLYEKWKIVLLSYFPQWMTW